MSGAPTLRCSEASPFTKCHCQKRIVGSIISAPAARAFKSSHNFVSRQWIGGVHRCGWLRLRWFFFAVAGWFWVRTRPSVQTAAVVVLDLRGRATVRGENPPETSQPPLEVPRNARSLNLELPIGSNEGAYDVALLNPSGAELFRTSATAKLEDHIVVLRADVDLAGVSPGSYFLGVRQPGLEWTRFPIRVL